MESYNRALCEEIDLFTKAYPQCRVPTIYIGGGTPSTWPDELLLDMSGRIVNVMKFLLPSEVTIEVNPGTVVPRQFKLWRGIGINRLSIGVQYNDSAVLAALNRYQAIEDVIELLDCARKEFDNISVDVMLGLPNVNKSCWRSFLEEVVKWPIQHISLYCLMVHEFTPLYFKVARNEVVLPENDMVADLYIWSIEFLESKGFSHYEVSNFARPGYESKHNCVYWDRKPYKGFGLGACSFDGISRYANEQNLMHYVELLNAGSDPVIFKEGLTPSDVRLERIMLGLRRSSGVTLNDLFFSIPLSKQHAIQTKIAQLCSAGYLIIEDDRVKLTKSGFIVEQEIIAQLA